jgi:hypothetical protein
MHAKGQRSTISVDEAIAALRERAAEEASASGVGDITEADEEAMRLMVSAGKFTRRIDDEDEARHQPAERTLRRIAPALKRKPVKAFQPAAKRRMEPGNGAAGPAPSDRKTDIVAQSVKPNGPASTVAAPKPQPAGLGLGAYSSGSGSDSGER